MIISYLKNASFLILGILLFISCEKEEVHLSSSVVATETDQSRSQESCDCDAKIAEVESDGEMLSFASVEDLLIVEDCLKQRVEEHIAAFSAPYEDLDDDAYLDIVEEMGFDENLPLKQQAEAWGITSLHTVLDEALDEWLASSGPELDMETYPGGHFVLSEAFRALLNSQGQVRIANEVTTIGEEEGFTGEGSAKRRATIGECIKRAYDYKGFNFNNNRSRMIVEGSIYSFASIERSGSKTRLLRWKNNRWKRDPERGINTIIGGDFRNKDCERLLDENEQGDIWAADFTRVRKSHISTSVIRWLVVVPRGHLFHGLSDIRVQGYYQNATFSYSL